MLPGIAGPRPSMRPSEALTLYHAALRQLLNRYGFRQPRVFGSVLTRTDTEESGLDVLVEPVARLIVVLDASTFVSAALKADSVPERALLRAVNEPNRILLSQEVKEEYSRDHLPAEVRPIRLPRAC